MANCLAQSARSISKRASTAAFICLLSLVSASLPSQAAVQGTSGSTASSGSVEINLIQGLTARITGLADLPLGTWSGVGSLTGEQDICIGTRGTASPYRIRASGDGEPGDPSAFTLSNGAQTLKYNAWFNDFPSADTARVPLIGGVTLTGQNSPGFRFGPFILNGIILRNFNMGGCRLRNANISIEVPESELAGNSSGTYTGTLTLLLLPE